MLFYWTGSYVWDFFGRSPATASQKTLRDVLDCALDKTVPSEGIARKKAKATLDFLGDKLADGMESYGLSSDVEKAHFLSQVMYESENFTLMIEYAGGRTWRDDAVFDSRYSSWKCGGYLSAVHSDKDFFDNKYHKSMNGYKATFRGRGLIQLTHCYNYMGFFYHFLSKQQNLTNLKVDGFTYTYGGEDKVLKESFCGREELESIVEGFRRDGLHVTRELAADFEDVLDRLSLPCDLDPIIASSMHEAELLVEPSLWFWDSCREENPRAAGEPTGRAVGTLSGCVHGSDIYLKFDETWCNNGVPDEDRLKRLQDEVSSQKRKRDRQRYLTCKSYDLI